MSMSTKQSNQGGHGLDVDTNGDRERPISRRRRTTLLRLRRWTRLSARQSRAGWEEERERSRSVPQIERTGASGDRGIGDSGGGHGGNSDSQEQRDPGATPQEPRAERTGAAGDHCDDDRGSGRGRDSEHQCGPSRPEEWRTGMERRLRELQRDLEAGDVDHGPNPEVSALIQHGADAEDGGPDPGEIVAAGIAVEEHAAPVGRGILASRASVALRLLGHNEHAPQVVFDTGTIYLYAVSVVVDASRSKAWKWFVACMTLLLVFLQGMTLGALLSETRFPSCNAITDCPAGTFCHVYYGVQPRCVDCGINDWLGACEDNCDHNIVYGDIEGHPLKLNQWSNLTGYQETCSAIIPAGIWEHRDYYNADYSQLPLTGSEAEWVKRRTLPDGNREEKWHGEKFHNQRNEDEYTFNKYLCLAANHCIQTDMDSDTNFQGHCDFVTQNRQKMDKANWLVIFFLTLLWMLPVTLDIEEAKLEEIVLAFHLKGYLNVPAELVRVTLRFRILVLPIMTTYATFIVLVTDDMTAKNMILNFLAITFIIEADNMLSVLFLGSNQQKRMAAIANRVDEDVEKTALATFFWTRLQGLMCAVILICFVFWVETFAKEGCAKLDSIGSVFSRYLYAAILGIRFFYIIYKTVENRTHSQRFLAALIDTCQTISAVLIAIAMKQLLIFSETA